MHFKTAAEIKAQKEAAGKSAQQEEKRKAKLEEKAQRKYDKLAAEAAKRETNRKPKPKVTVLPGVIVAPALLEAKKELATVTGRLSSKSHNISNAPKQKSEPKAGAKQTWDDASKQWVKLG